MSEKYISTRPTQIPSVHTNHNFLQKNVIIIALGLRPFENIVLWQALPFIFLLFVLLSSKRLLYSRGWKGKGSQCLLSNGQHPTNQIQGGRNRRGQNNYVPQKLIAYQTLLFFKAKVWSAGGGRTCLAGTELSASPCPPACAHSHSGVMLIDKVSLGILAPVAHILGEGSVVMQGLRFLSCFCLDVYGTRPSQVHAAVVTWSSWQPWDRIP